jgi:hypothetical protein
MLPANFTPPVIMTWCAKSSPDESLQRRDLVSAIQFVCGQPRLPNPAGAERLGDGRGAEA